MTAPVLTSTLDREAPDAKARFEHNTSLATDLRSTVAAAALFSVPTGGLAAAVLTAPAEQPAQELQAGLAANATDLGTASMNLDRPSSPASFAPVAAPTTGSDIVNAQVVESQKLPVPEQEVEDPSLDEGTRTVVDPGREGARSIIWRVTYDQGREIARERLAELIRKALEKLKRRIPTRPTLGSKRRRLEGKKQRGEVKALRGKVDPGN